MNGTGRGLIGMRERVAVLGGKIETGPMRNGYSVVAELPLEPV
jgi:glucose-6-phosphate-specific signal transduction histidine kinase